MMLHGEMFRPALFRIGIWPSRLNDEARGIGFRGSGFSGFGGLKFMASVFKVSGFRGLGGFRVQGVWV